MPAAERIPEDCPCGLGRAYSACCGPLHALAESAPTAERLMRSRYSAFAVANIDYLLATWHPATRPEALELMPQIQWRRLRIRRVIGGTDADDAGTVEFVAHYRDSARQEYGRQHENSRFVRDAGRWVYVEPVL